MALKKITVCDLDNYLTASGDMLASYRNIIYTLICLNDITIDAKILESYHNKILSLMGENKNYHVIQKIIALKQNMTSDYESKSDTYRKLLYLGNRSAKILGCKTLSSYYDKDRFESPEIIYTIIRKRLQGYSGYVDGDLLIDKMMSDVIFFDGDYFMDPVALLQKFDIPIKNYSPERIVIEANGKEHVILIERGKVSQTTSFMYEGLTHHVITLANDRSFCHEMGHVIEHIMFDDGCYDVVGKKFYGEVISILFEYFNGENYVTAHKNNPFNILMAGFDHYINSINHYKIPSAYDVFNIFNDYMKMMFPGISKVTRQYYLACDYLMLNISKMIDYDICHYYSEMIYVKVLKKNIHDIGSSQFVRQFMKQRFRTRDECEKFMTATHYNQQS